MKTKDTLIRLIELLDEFETQNPGLEEISILDFLGFMNSKYSANNLKTRSMAGELNPEIVEMGANHETEIARLVSIMYRYAKHYIKKALEGNIIQTPEEFSYLIILLTHESLTKTELIQKNIMEKTSGTEVIKRLLNNELLTQFNDPNDKRSQRVAITAKGRQTIFSLLPQMQIVSNIVAGNLTAQEKNTLAYLLKKLDYHHHDLYTNDRNASLEDLNN